MTNRRDKLAVVALRESVFERRIDDAAFPPNPESSFSIIVENPEEIVRFTTGTVYNFLPICENCNF